MAARLNPQHDAKTREKIKTSQLVNRLQSFVDGKVEMSPAQVTAANILLKKVLPDLQAVQLSGDPERPLVSRVERVVVRPTNTNG